MAKIQRYEGNLQAFASAATGQERVVFGNDDNPPVQSDDLTANINSNFARGWGVLPLGNKPPREWFNSVAFAATQLSAYQHQVGVPEWDDEQEYHAGSITNVGGKLYSSVANDNIGNEPSSSAMWKPIERLMNVKDFGAVGDGVTDDTAAFQAAFDTGYPYIPEGEFLVSSITLRPEGGVITGEGYQKSIIKKIPDTAGDVLYSAAGDNLPHWIMRDFAIDGSRGSFATGELCDGIRLEGGVISGSNSVVGYNVRVTATTGSGWYIGPNRNAPNLLFCYGFNVGSLVVDSTSLGRGNGLHLDGLSDAYVGAGCGFGSSANRSVLAARCATPVISEVEIWWANNRANIEIFECKGYTVRGCNIDRARVSGLRVQGRSGSGLDTPTNYFEAGVVEGNGFLFPRGLGGAGSDGDVNFIEVYNAIGINFTSNHFVTQVGGEEIKADYLIFATGSSYLGWTGNASAPEGDAYCPFVSGVTNDEGALWVDMTETLKNFKGSINVESRSPSYRFDANGSQAANRKKSRIRVEDTSDGDLVWESVSDDESSSESFLRFRRNGFNVFEAILGGMLIIESYANVSSLPVSSARTQWALAIVENDGSGNPALALNDGSAWRLNSFT